MDTTVIEFQAQGYTVKYDIYQILLLVAFLISLYKWERTDEKFLISSFLFFCVLFELLISEILSQLYRDNTSSYNLYLIFVSTYYLLIFKKSLDYLKVVPVQRIATIFALLSTTYVLILDITTLHVYPYLIGLVLATILICFYLFNLFDTSDSFTNAIKKPLFWLGSGILIFASINFPILFHIEEIRFSQNLALPLFKTLQYSNIVLALSYVISVICHLQTKLY